MATASMENTSCHKPGLPMVIKHDPALYESFFLFHQISTVSIYEGNLIAFPLSAKKNGEPSIICAKTIAS